MDINPILFWNILLTLVVAPLMYNIRTNANEIKRVNILLNKTRDEPITMTNIEICYTLKMQSET